MNRMIVGAALFVLGSGTAIVGARDNIALLGSDTLEFAVDQIIAACPGAYLRGISSLGGGSANAEVAMNTLTAPPMPPPDTWRQNVGFMSRFLSPTLSPNGGNCAKGSVAEGLHIGFEGGVIVADATTASACGQAVAYTRSFSVTA